MLSGAAARKHYVKKGFLKISQNSQENNCVKAGFGLGTFQ